MPNFEIAIVGAGIAGVTLAIALHYRGINVTIYESARAFGEIGAGVAFGPNAVQAMRICHEGVEQAFQRVRTRNIWPSKEKVWFDYVDAYGQGEPKIEFTVSNGMGQSGVHRAIFLEQLVKLLPEGIAKFSKRVSSIEENGADKKVVIHFTDGTSAEADAVVGCDGIKSAVRRHVVGEDSPSAWPGYTGKYAYRALVPMSDAIEAVGKEIAENAFMHMGPDGHMLTFPVNHGALVNLVAFKTSSEGWDDPLRMTKPARQEDLLRDFAGYKPYIQKLIKLTKPEMDIWAIYDLGDHPVSTFYKGRVCLLGDAAHATSPHHGAGGGFCIEDSAVLATLLLAAVETRADKEGKDIPFESVFAAFDASRRERSQWLVQSSRFIGDCYQWRAEGVDRDFVRMEEEINRRVGIVSTFDVMDACEKAKEDLARRLRT
ncbi:hypothetical protein UA08_03486 [Talaromyces atroroseus]|uniref:FAD-binding domain-containing protein n=1 Tax=Talaromyces atroroseus TaxID=1441469 RepID=A0A225AZU3_TALAT|nr:hypothetical protein UA08_03486 [Talaromyces atroroseus]OKL61229.1 hypothetical protein UA08_03486 [Talaromyces atroroseus]